MNFTSDDLNAKTNDFFIYRIFGRLEKLLDALLTKGTEWEILQESSHRVVPLKNFDQRELKRKHKFNVK